MSLQKSSPWRRSWTCGAKTLESRWARVVFPAEEGPEMPSKNTGSLSDAVGWPVGGSVGIAIRAVEFGIDVVRRVAGLSSLFVYSC